MSGSGLGSVCDSGFLYYNVRVRLWLVCSGGFFYNVRVRLRLVFGGIFHIMLG